MDEIFERDNKRLDFRVIWICVLDSVCLAVQSRELSVGAR